MNKTAGYSLLELLLALLILSIAFAGIGFASYREYSRRQLIYSAQRTILSDLRAAQKDAASGRKPTGCTGTLAGYLFNATNCVSGNCTQYTLSASCAGNTPVIVKQASMPNGVTFSTSMNNVLFKSLSHGTNISSGGSVSITLNDTRNNIRLFTTISDSGEIK